MGRLSTLTVLLILGAWGAATEGASPDDAISSPAKAARKPAPVPPIKYLEAGSRLFNSGNFELGAKYLDAAQMYRDQLQQDEQTMLDAYLKELSKVRASTAAGSTATDGAGAAKTAASPAMTPAAVQAAPAMTDGAGAAKTAASPAMTPAAVQAAPAMTDGAGAAKTAASPAMTPAAVQAAPAMTDGAGAAKTAASPAMTPAAVQAAPAMTDGAGAAKTAASPAMTPAAVQAAPAMTDGAGAAKTAASPAMTPAAVQAAPAMTDGAGAAKTAASPAMTPAAVQAAPAMTDGAGAAKTAASPAMTPAAVQAAPAMTDGAGAAKTAASPAMTPAAVQAAPAMTDGAGAAKTAASPAMTPAAVQAAASPAMTPAAVQAAPAMTPAAVQAAPATTSVIQSGDPARGGAGDVAITPDVKQHAVWLLHEAREQMAQGNFDAAEKKIAEAEAIDIKWGLFDDTPTKVRTDLNKERPKSLASTSKRAQSLPHNRENAHALLREARAVLANHQIDQAEAIAQEVKSWNLSYSFFGDNPDKVAAAARALRKRDKIRNTPTRERARQGVYDVLVQESRQLMKLGKLNEAEAKALQAQRMNVVPALTADRAESVLHDIAMARVRSGSGSPAATPAAEAPSLVAEHEANDLLNKGDQAKAAAKFVESEKLRDKESGRAAIGQALATAAPSVDASIQKSSGAESATEPLPAAPGAAGSPTPDKPAAPAPDSQPRPEPPGQGDALAAPGAAGSPTPAQPAAPALDSQPKPEPPGQGDALAAPGAAGSPTPAQPAAPAPDSQPKPEPPGQGDAPGAGTRRGWIAHPCSACRSCSRQPAQA